MAGLNRSAALAYLLALGVAAPAASAAAASAPSFEGNAVEWRPLTPLPAPLSDFSATLLAATAAGEPDEIAITGGCAAAQVRASAAPAFAFCLGGIFRQRTSVRAIRMPQTLRVRAAQVDPFLTDTAILWRWKSKPYICALDGPWLMWLLIC